VSTRNTVTRIETRTRRRTEIERRERDPDPESGRAEKSNAEPRVKKERLDPAFEDNSGQSSCPPRSF